MMRARAAVRRLWRRIQSCRAVPWAIALALTGAAASASCLDGSEIGTQMPETVSHHLQSFIPAGGLIVSAAFDNPTRRYPHGVLGDEIEGGSLLVQVMNRLPDHGCRTIRLDLPRNAVFEDIRPRIVTVNGDPRGNILTVLSTASGGASLVVYGLNADGTELVLLGATPPIGRSNRWLAPIGVADLDADGRLEIAYIDRPHLARTLRILRVGVRSDGRIALEEIAAQTGLTNHRIGEDFISSRIAFCNNDESWVILTANRDWSRLMATRLRPDGTLDTRDIGPWPGRDLSRAHPCPD